MEKELQKQMIRRNIIFWGRCAEKYIITTVAVMWCYAFVWSLLGGKYVFVGNGEIWSVLFIYHLMLMLISTLIAPMSYGIAYIPLVISFGSKRAEAVWGLQVLNWLVLGEMGAVLLLLAGLSSFASDQIVLLVGIILFGGMTGIALGQFATAAGFRFGMKGIVCVILVLLGFSILIGGMTIVFLFRDGKIFIESYWMVIGAGVAVMLYIGSIVLLLRVIRNYEVRR